MRPASESLTMQIKNLAARQQQTSADNFDGEELKHYFIK
jgi:hypothetical protein